MPDDPRSAPPAPTFAYHQRVLDQLAVHGLCPRPDTPPARLRDALSDLYRHEIRTARANLLAGRIERRDYAGSIVELRKRYWLLSVPPELWLVPSGAAAGKDQAAERGKPEAGSWKPEAGS